jgi:hypothetical protein
MSDKPWFVHNTECEAYRVYNGSEEEGPILLGFVFKHKESDMWHAEHPKLSVYLSGKDKEALIQELREKVLYLVKRG